MPRSVNAVASRARRKKILKETKGNYGARKNVWTVAKNTYEKGLQYAYRDRKTKKRNFRALWIQRINAAARIEGMSYSQLMGGLKKAYVEIDRKALAYLAVEHPDAFKAVVQTAKDGLEGKVKKIEPAPEKATPKAEKTAQKKEITETAEASPKVKQEAKTEAAKLEKKVEEKVKPEEAPPVPKTKPKAKKAPAAPKPAAKKTEAKPKVEKEEEEKKPVSKAAPKTKAEAPKKSTSSKAKAAPKAKKEDVKAEETKAEKE